MSKEFGGKLEKHIMHEYWGLVYEKAHKVFEGVWNKRDMLPTTHSYDYGEELLSDYLEIPLLGDGYIKLGKTAASDPELAVQIKLPTARGEIIEDSFIVQKRKNHKDNSYPFDIFWDEPEDEEYMKFLARMNPDKDIDWDRIDIHSDAYQIAVDMSLSYAKD